MNTIDTLAESGELRPFVDFTRKYQDSPSLRARAETEPRAVLSEHGIHTPPGCDVRIVVNTEDTFNLVMPPDPNSVLAEEDLATVAGGVRTDRCASTLISCVLTFS